MGVKCFAFLGFVWDLGADDIFFSLWCGLISRGFVFDDACGGIFGLEMEEKRAAAGVGRSGIEGGLDDDRGDHDCMPRFKIIDSPSGMRLKCLVL